MKEQTHSVQVFFNVMETICVNSLNLPYAKLDDYFYRVEQEFVDAFYTYELTDETTSNAHQMPRMNF